MMKKWTMKADRDRNGVPIDFEGFGRQFGVSSILAKLLVNRHLNTQEKVNRYLYGGLEQLENPYLLKGVQKAAGLLYDAEKKNKHIRIIGDYDVDGVMSVYILMEGLRTCGITADYEIPHRLLHGYGLNVEMVEKAAQDGVELLITCDNGISAREAVAHAKELGMCVIITDHHEVPYRTLEDGSRQTLIPAADAVVNPKQEDCPYPMKGICGAYVAFRLVQVLFDLYTAVHSMVVQRCITVQGEWTVPQECRRERGVAQELMYLVPFAALATVCDVMELTEENRCLVREGLKLLPLTKNTGMRALVYACGLEDKSLNSYHFGFIIGPCINSAGRLCSADMAEELFFMEDQEEAAQRSEQLCLLNQSRKQMTEDGAEVASSMVEQQLKENGKIDDVLVLYLPDCHESIAGIVASKIREKYFRPTLVLTDPAEGNPLKGSGIVKGSGRSIPGYSMYERLCEAEGCLEKFGGHPMAAGLSMRKEQINELREVLNRHSGLTEKDFTETLVADGILPFSMLSVKLVKELSFLQPYGNGNEAPIFGLLHVKITSARYMGQNNRFLRLYLRDDSVQSVFEAPLFSKVDLFVKALSEAYGEEALERLLNNLPCDYRMDIMYSPELNVFRDIQKVQIKLIDYKF